MLASTPVSRSAAQRIAIIIAVVIQIGATFLPQLGLGEPIGDRSDSVRTLVTPSGWAFAIWGPLFFGSALFAIWQALPGQRDNTLLGKIGWLAVPALAMQGIWAIYTQFANLTFVSAIIILASLVSLLAILRIFVVQERPFSRGERWLVVLVFSCLAAWLTAASIVNISASLRFHGVGDGQEWPLLSAAILVVGGLIAALAVLRSRGNPFYAAVFLWALLAIYFRGGQEHGSIALTTMISAVLVLGAAIVGLGQRGNRYHWFG